MRAPMPADWMRRQAELVHERAKQADIIITTALIPGRKAPMLIGEETVKAMKPGSVIVDMAVEQGGNCPLSELGKTVTKYGVHIIGEPNLATLVPADASALYARNVLNFLKLSSTRTASLPSTATTRSSRRRCCAHGGEILANNKAGDIMEVSHTIINLIIFVLAIYVGYHVVWTVTPALHTPLMAVTNAISGDHHRRRDAGRRPDRRPARPDRWACWRWRSPRSMCSAASWSRSACSRCSGRRNRRRPRAPRRAGAGQGGREMINMAFVAMNLVTMLYLVASVCFIQALKGLSHPSTARRGNAFGMVGMAIAMLTTLALMVKLQHEAAAASGWAWAVLLGVVVGGVHRRHAGQARGDDQDAGAGRGDALADRPGGGVHRGGGGVRALGLRHRRARRADPHRQPLELFIGTFVGAITFSGSVIAFGKLAGKYKFRLFQGAPVELPGAAHDQPGAGVADDRLRHRVHAPDAGSWTPFILMTAIAFVLGVLIIIPIGGADMPVVVSMLNSYSGWAAAGIGFSLNNSMLIIAGSLVGSSGAILSYIMCKAMNRSFFNVILGGFGGEAAAAAGGGAGGSGR